MPTESPASEVFVEYVGALFDLPGASNGTIGSTSIVSAGMVKSGEGSQSQTTTKSNLGQRTTAPVPRQEAGERRGGMCHSSMFGGWAGNPFGSFFVVCGLRNGSVNLN